MQSNDVSGSSCHMLLKWQTLALRKYSSASCALLGSQLERSSLRVSRILSRVFGHDKRRTLYAGTGL